MASTATDDPPGLYRKLDAALLQAADYTLADYVRDRRDDRLSWAKIALRIFELTGISVSYEWLRQRFGMADTAS